MANNFSLGEAWISLRAKDDKLKTDLDQAESKASGHGGTIHGALRGVKKTAHVLSGGAGAAGIGAAIGGPQGAVVGEILDQMGQLAGKANPAAMAAFNRAFDDLQATIGQYFVPVLTAGTEVLKLTADIVGTVLVPVLGALHEAAVAAADGLRYVRDGLEKIGLLTPGISTARPTHITSQAQFLKSAYEQAGGGGHDAKMEGWMQKLVDNTSEQLSQIFIMGMDLRKWALAGGFAGDGTF